MPKTTKDSTLKGQIDQIDSRTPRYLFRAWTTNSGGQQGLNTTEAITPLAFTKKRSPSAIHEIQREKLASLMNDHMLGVRIVTPFSSWTQSLAYAIAFGNSMPLDELYISVVDTKKLKPGNKVLWSPGLQAISPKVHKNWIHEYLAYGIISGKMAYAAVSYRTLEKHGILELISSNASAVEYPWRHKSHRLPSTTLQFADTERALELAMDIGELYGDGFKVPLATYLLSFRQRSPEALVTIYRALTAAGPAPPEWIEDPTIMNKTAVDTAGFYDVEKAISVLRRLGLLRAMASNTTDEAGLRICAGDDAEEQIRVERENNEMPSAQYQLAVSGKVPRMVRELYTDLLGWTRADMEKLQRKWQ